MSGENKKMPHGLDFANAKSVLNELFKEITLVISNPCGNISFYKAGCACPCGNISFYKTRCACPCGNFKIFFCGKSIKTLLSILVMLALLSFSSLATAHIEHDCTGEDCAVCLTLEIARISLRSMAVAAAVFALSVHFLLTKRAMSAKSELEKVETLVTEKIKLSD